MLLQLIEQLPEKEPAFIPALLLAAFMVTYTGWSLRGIHRRGERLQGKTMVGIVIVLVSVMLAIVAWKDRCMIRRPL